MNRKTNLLFYCFFSLGLINSSGQQFHIFNEKAEDPSRLLTNRAIQIETTAAIDSMYNFNFDSSEQDFKWLLVKYPDHPIGHFLLGLNYWWRIVSDPKVERFDDQIHQYMDTSIDLASKLLEEDNENKEAAFFLAASYGFKGRLYAERENWVKSAWAGKNALKYLDESRGDQDINPELLFGDGLYNFYSEWIPENYKSLKPILMFFKKGDKELGIKQLENVSQNAFYTRLEARYFLIQIYAMENKHFKALQMAKMMHVLYPNNSFFHRYVARSSFVLSKFKDAEIYANELLENIRIEKYGYTANEGRYGAYILGYIYQKNRHDYETAKFYYQKCIAFSLSNNSLNSGYFLGAHLAMGDMAFEAKDYLIAERAYRSIIDRKNKKSSSYKEAKKRLKELKKEVRAAKRRKI